MWSIFTIHLYTHVYILFYGVYFVLFEYVVAYFYISNTVRSVCLPLLLFVSAVSSVTSPSPVSCYHLIICLTHVTCCLLGYIYTSLLSQSFCGHWFVFMLVSCGPAWWGRGVCLGITCFLICWTLTNTVLQKCSCAALDSNNCNSKYRWKKHWILTKIMMKLPEHSM